MTYYNSKFLVALLTVATCAGSTFADDVRLCGAAIDNAAESAPGLLDDEFRALLSGSKPVENNSAPSNTQPISSKAVDTSKPTLVEVAPVAKKRLPRTCVLRDPDNERELLTMTIPGNVLAERISPDELAAQREAMESAPDQAALQYEYANDDHPRLMIRRDAKTAAIHVDAHNSDVRDVLRGIASRTGKRILFHPDLEGTISTTTKAEGVVVLVRTMLEPFSFSVVASANHLVVCGPNETPGSVLAAISKKNAIRRNTETRPAIAAKQTSPSATAPRLNPVLHPAKEQAIQLVTAQINPAAPPRPHPVKPQIVPATMEGIASERIARVAQNAFAAGQSEYATEVLQQGLKRFPSSAMLRRVLGESLYLEGDFTEAAKVLSSSLRLDKREPLANELMGKTLKALGQKERAYHYLLQAQQIRKAMR